MKRIVVLGGLGLFGRTAADLLRRFGLPMQVASRNPRADIQIDADDPASIRSALIRGDVVVDAAGPFQARSTALIATAVEVGFDVIDINDSLTYAENVLSLREGIDRAGIRVLNSASSVSATSAAVVARSGVGEPVRVTVFLAPASRHTANPDSARSLIRSAGLALRTWRHGRLETRRGWDDARRFPMPQPVGTIRGRLFESADALYLPRIWPSLVEVDMYVDANTPGVNALLSLGARSAVFRRFLERQVRLGERISRWIGAATGGLGYEIEGADGQIARFAVVSERSGFIAPVAPAVLGARHIAAGSFEPRGLVLPDRHVDGDELFEYLESMGITIVELA